MAKRSPIAIIASNVRSLRLAKEWSQGELARRAGVSKKVISNLENADKLQISPTIDTVSSVAEAFGLSMLALMTSIPIDRMMRLSEMRLEKLIDSYTEMPPDGQKTVDRIMELKNRSH